MAGKNVQTIMEMAIQITPTVHRIHAQLQSIEVGELPDTMHGTWSMVCGSARELCVLVDNLNEDTIDHQTSYDFRVPTSRLVGGLTVLSLVQKNSNIISSVTLAQMQIALQHAKSLLAIYDSVAQRQP